jgi:acetylglutamate kinase
VTAEARRTVVLKLGGELLEAAPDLERVAAGVAALAGRVRLVVVHGGGREIDAALSAAGIAKVQVDGVRVTDSATLGVVVAVLAGAINTRLVAAVRAAGGRPVGLTGADAGVVSVRRAGRMTTAAGARVGLGLVGMPINNGAPELVTDLLSRGYVPIVACIGAARDGQLLNVNADTLAAHLAAELGAARLVIAGGTSGVLDGAGRTIARLTAREAGRMIREGTANAGMVAKLQACRAAVRAGVGDVLIVNGREVDLGRLEGLPRRSGKAAASEAAEAGFTRVVA